MRDNRFSSARAIRLYAAGLHGYFPSHMQPDVSYKKLQKELLRLIEQRDQTSQRRGVEKRLEKQFMADWQLMPDRRGLSGKLERAIHFFSMRIQRPIVGMVKCRFYTGVYDQRVITAQPYNPLLSDIESGLTLDDGLCPQIIEAPEWSFHYPAHTGLFILKFPAGYAEAMEKFERAIRRAENEETCWCRQQSNELESEGEPSECWKYAEDDDLLAPA